MAIPFRPRSTKQRLADTRLSVRRGPTVGQDTESRDPFSPTSVSKPKAFGGGAPKFQIKGPSFGRRTSRARSYGRGY